MPLDTLGLNHDFVKLNKAQKKHLVSLVTRAQAANLAAKHAESDAFVESAVRLYGKDSMLLAFGLYVYDVNNA